MSEHINVSCSRLSLFLRCEQAYYAKYILKLPDPGNAKAALGSCIHDVFELVSSPSKHEVRKKYIKYSIENDGLHPTIERLYKRLLKKHAIPEIYRTPKSETNLHELGYDLMANAFKRGYTLHAKILDVEKHFEIPVSPNVSIKGFIDKVVELDEDSIEIIDYKSGIPFSAEKCAEEYQPLLYKIAAKQLYPKYKNIVFSYHFLKNKKTVPVPTTESQLKNFLRFAVAQGIRMLKITKESATYNSSEKWMCNCCPFKQPNLEKGYSGCPGHFDKDGNSLYRY